MKLCEYLSVPYLVESASVERAPGVWVRHVRHPELPECETEAQTLEDALTLLERRRVELIVASLRSGKEPPVPRPPLRRQAIAATIERLGLSADLAAMLDHDGRTLTATRTSETSL